MAKKIRVNKQDAGRYVRVGYTDIGAVDGIITHVDGPNDFHFIDLQGDNTGSHHWSGDVIAIGKKVNAVDSGL